jgi:hypothetical protein
MYIEVLHCGIATTTYTYTKSSPKRSYDPTLKEETRNRAK